MKIPFLTFATLASLVIVWQALAIRDVKTRPASSEVRQQRPPGKLKDVHRFPAKGAASAEYLAFFREVDATATPAVRAATTLDWSSRLTTHEDFANALAAMTDPALSTAERARLSAHYGAGLFTQWGAFDPRAALVAWQKLSPEMRLSIRGEARVRRGEKDEYREDFDPNGLNSEAIWLGWAGRDLPGLLAAVDADRKLGANEKKPIGQYKEMIYRTLGENYPVEMVRYWSRESDPYNHLLGVIADALVLELGSHEAAIAEFAKIKGSLALFHKTQLYSGMLSDPQSSPAQRDTAIDGLIQGWEFRVAAHELRVSDRVQNLTDPLTTQQRRRLYEGALNIAAKSDPSTVDPKGVEMIRDLLKNLGP